MKTGAALHITTSFPLHEGHASGVFVWEQVRALVQTDWEVTVLAPHAQGAARREKVQGVEIRRFRYLPQKAEKVAYEGGIPANLAEHPARWLAIPPFFAAALAGLVTNIERFDILHAHWSFSGMLAALATRIRKKPFVVSFHGSDLMGASGPMRRVAGIAAGSASRVIVHSRVMAEAAARIADGQKIVQLPHGIDVDSIPQAEPDQGDQVRIIAVGRLAPEKGFDSLIRALHSLKHKKGWTCEIIGEGPEDKALAALAAELEVADRVRLAGPLPHQEVLRRYAESHIAVVPSVREGFGVACLEACAAALPVVATRSGGPDEIIDPDVSGILVQPNSPEDLAGALSKLLDAPEKRKEIGWAGRRIAEQRFSITAATENLIKLYRTVLDW